MGPDDSITAINFSAALPQIPDQFFAGLELGAGIFVNTLPPEEAAARLQNEGPH